MQSQDRQILLKFTKQLIGLRVLFISFVIMSPLSYNFLSIELEDNVTLESESLTRVISKNKLIMMLSDEFVNKNYLSLGYGLSNDKVLTNEVLLFHTLGEVKKIINNKKIVNIKVSQIGDLEIEL